MPEAAPATAPSFSGSYAEARGSFCSAAVAAGLTSEAFEHPLCGRDGERLAIDVAVDGAAPATDRLLIVSSGCHGVEGYCGSAVQRMLLTDAAFRHACRAAGVDVLYLHALNPWGFSWGHRCTEDNVDLNRNFIDFSRPPPANPGYDELAALLVPGQWPADGANRAAVGRFIATQGMPAVQAAVSGGQFRHPDGLFYGGAAPTWSNRQLRTILRRHGRQRRRVAWIDLHSGLGPYGVAEPILAAHDDPVTLARARRWWGPRVTSMHEGDSSSAPLHGPMYNAIADECPAVEYTGIALEFGTLPLLDVIDALRADQWLKNHPEAAAPQMATAIRQQVRDAFVVDSEDWRQSILQQAAVAALQAVAGLSA